MPSTHGRLSSPSLTTLSDALRNSRLIDLSHPLEEHMPHYPTHSKFFHNLWGSYWHGDRALTYQLVMNEHNGTHVDAPAHFISDAKHESHVTIENVPLDRLMGRGARLDCQELCEGDYVSADFIARWEGEHAALEASDIVLFNFGWSEHWGLRPHHRRYVNDWPGVSTEAAEYLLGRSVAAIGVDTLSPDPPQALRTNPIHPLVLGKEVLIIENLCNLELLPDFFLFLALPLKIRAGSGSPIRAVAVVGI
jgi:kynurenine formamidase